MEVWKDIENYENLYQVSSYGNIRSKDRIVKCWNNKTKMIKGKIIKPMLLRDGYLYVHLYKDTKRKDYAVHRIVAKTFIENKESKEEVNHINGNKKDNSANNLEWVTPSENILHAYRTGLIVRKRELVGDIE